MSPVKVAASNVPARMALLKAPANRPSPPFSASLAFDRLDIYSLLLEVTCCRSSSARKIVERLWTSRNAGMHARRRFARAVHFRRGGDEDFTPEAVARRTAW